MVGTLRVRVRKEVNESAVMAELAALCAPHTAHLTIQIEKGSETTTYTRIKPCNVLSSPTSRNSV